MEIVGLGRLLVYLAEGPGPLIVLCFAAVNLTLGVLDFLYWNNIGAGIFNSILAFGGFHFFVQLVKRRKVHRYEYRHTGRHPRRAGKIEEEEACTEGHGGSLCFIGMDCLIEG